MLFNVVSDGVDFIVVVWVIFGIVEDCCVVCECDVVVGCGIVEVGWEGGRIGGLCWWIDVVVVRLVGEEWGGWDGVG